MIIYDVNYVRTFCVTTDNLKNILEQKFHIVNENFIEALTQFLDIASKDYTNKLDSKLRQTYYLDRDGEGIAFRLYRHIADPFSQKFIIDLLTQMKDVSDVNDKIIPGEILNIAHELAKGKPNR